jgi:hypothetical protein
MDTTNLFRIFLTLTSLNLKNGIMVLNSLWYHWICSRPSGHCQPYPGTPIERNRRRRSSTTALADARAPLLLTDARFSTGSGDPPRTTAADESARCWTIHMTPTHIARAGDLAAAESTLATAPTPHPPSPLVIPSLLPISDEDPPTRRSASSALSRPPRAPTAPPSRFAHGWVTSPPER